MCVVAYLLCMARYVCRPVCARSGTRLPAFVTRSGRTSKRCWTRGLRTRGETHTPTSSSTRTGRFGLMPRTRTRAGAWTTPSCLPLRNTWWYAFLSVVVVDVGCNTWTNRPRSPPLPCVWCSRRRTRLFVRQWTAAIMCPSVWTLHSKIGDLTYSCDGVGTAHTVVGFGTAHTQ